MAAYYNEIDAGAAQWLRNLIAAGLIAPGDVDERSISDVRADDLVGYDQCHFFAGIGGWSYALRLAGWPDDRPVWTGSCPCQPFSSAGRGGGFDDSRHLWPEFFRLIRERRPSVVFGEQVASALGRGWLSAVRADLESVGYAVGAADLCAAGIGASHIRQRLYWVADRDRGGLSRDGERDGDAQPRQGQRDDAGGRGEVRGGLADANHARLEGRRGGGDGTAQRPAWSSRMVDCSDGKSRPVPTQPGLQPLADGVPGRIVALRGAGNAIVPQLAAEFVSAWCET
jgi:DNA (cytosine-5)-methyltransferase 1